LAQFFQAALPTKLPAITVPGVVTINPLAVSGGSFLSDPRCYYDAPTKRWFLISLEIDTITTGVFGRAHNLVAVSKTSDPTGDFWLYSFDVTDDGTNGTPLHLTCPCLGDQPLLGADANGFYLSTNEFSDAEVFPIAPPPALNGTINTVFTLPDFRNGQAQVYAMPKLKMEQGGNIPVVSYDTADIALPASSPRGSLWSSLQPSHSPPGDLSSPPPNGAEYFLSSIDFDTHGATQIAAFALTNTAALAASNSPTASQMPMQHVFLTPGSGGYMAAPPDGSPFSAVQKDGPKPMADGCVPTACTLETLNANDDRMNTVMLTNGVLWSALNTVLPPISVGAAGPDGHYRVGIQYYAVVPKIVDGKLQASMLRDGYLNVPKENVLFPSIGAAPTGAVVMGFTLSGKDYYPSAAWTRLDLPTGSSGPEVHISGAGTGPEDGFTGYPVQGIISDPTGGQISNGVSRWGDYSATEVDEQGCIWSAAEFIPAGKRDLFAGNWGTFITRVSPGGKTCALATPVAIQQNVAGVGAELPNTATQNPVFYLFAGLLTLLAVIGGGAVLKRLPLRI
jgi:hypothetical protein